MIETRDVEHKNIIEGFLVLRAKSKEEAVNAVKNKLYAYDGNIDRAVVLSQHNLATMTTDYRVAFNADTAVVESMGHPWEYLKDFIGAGDKE